MRYYFLRFPGGKPKAVTFSYDDGVKQDLRLAEIFKKHGIKATFNINGRRAESTSQLPLAEIKEKLFDQGFELAIHGKSHMAPGLVSSQHGIADVLDCRRELEALLGTIVRGLAYPDSGIRIPYATGAETVKRYLADLGVAYARTLGQDNDSFQLPEDFYNWIPTAHHDHPEVLDWARKFAETSLAEIYHSSRYPRLFYLWGHSYEFDRNDNWDRIEALCAILGGKEDIWYATNIEICDYVNACRALQYSADQSLVYNPACIPVILACTKSGEEKQFTVHPGETVHLIY